MSNKQFAERLNKELDGLGVPIPSHERIAAFATWMRIPKFKAETLLNGGISPESGLLELIADELEVNSDWLLGKSEQRLKRSRAS